MHAENWNVEGFNPSIKNNQTWTQEATITNTKFRNAEQLPSRWILNADKRNAESEGQKSVREDKNI